MKATFIVLLSGLLFCGCSLKQASSVSSAVDLVQAGKSTTWNQDSYSLHVAKRDGNSLQGVRLVLKSIRGDEATWTADTGTVASGWFTNSSGSLTHIADKDYVTITLLNPQLVGHEQQSVRAEAFTLRRFPQPNNSLQPTATAPSTLSDK